MLDSELRDMKEDLIERVTSMFFSNEGLTNLVLNLCQIATQDEEKKLKDRLIQSTSIDFNPQTLAVSKYFTLAENSKIVDFYLNQLSQEIPMSMFRC